MAQLFFNFKMRMSSADWGILSDVMIHQNPFYTNKAQRDWFFNQVNRFCRDIAIPFLEKQREAAEVVEKNVFIKEMPVGQSENIDILRKFTDAIHTNPYHTAQREWFFNEINRFCREIAIPFIEHFKDAPNSQVEKCINIQETCFDDTTNIAIVREYAALNKTTVTQTIQKWIVDPPIVFEKRARAAEQMAARYMMICDERVRAAEQRAEQYRIACEERIRIAEKRMVN